MPIRLESLTATKINELNRESTVFFFPVGPLEDHGPHLPVGLDLMDADKQAFLVAERIEKEMPGWTSVLMPRAPLGIDANTSVIAITVRPHVLRDWLVDSTRALNRLGFRHFVCFSGHHGPKQLTAIEEAGKIVRSGFFFGASRLLKRRPKPILLSASSVMVEPGSIFRAAVWPDPKEHGGRQDTSVALAICPEMVDQDYRMLQANPKKGTRFSRLMSRYLGKTKGYWGNPSQSSAEIGEEDLKQKTEEITAKLKMALEGRGAERLFRSWYSLIPSNGSFFKAWVLVGIFALFMTFWVYLLFETMTTK
jgi:creatinine amidohydrolase